MVDDLDVFDNLDIEWFYRVVAPYMGSPTMGAANFHQIEKRFSPFVDAIRNIALHYILN
jgi:hypothetical protein